jgi:hypothetical protein
LHKWSWQVHPAFVHVLPQSSELPHPSPTIPQYWSPFAVVQAKGVHTPTPPLHRWFWQVQPVLLQVLGQSSELPHPSPTVPQYWSPFAVLHVAATHPALGPALHKPFVHTQPALGQVALHASVPPQPFPIDPQ